MNDPLSDMISRIHNAQMRNKSKVSSPSSRLRVSVLDVLKTEGFIRDVPVHRSDRCYRIANEPHRIVEHVTPVLGNLLDIVIVL